MEDRRKLASAETRVTHLYLDSDGHANTSAGDGRLTFCQAGAEKCDGYAYDPENPSQHIIDMSENEIEVPEDYTREELRQTCCATPPCAEGKPGSDR